MLDPFKIIVELSNPKNALELWDYIKDYAIPIVTALGGGGLVSLIFTSRINKKQEKFKGDIQRELEAFKAEQGERVQKKIESHKAQLQTTANALSLELSEKITRRSKAYDFLTGIEYDFYSKLLVCLQTTSNKKMELLSSLMHYDASNPSLLLNAQTEYKQSLNEIRELHLSVLHIISQDLSDIIEEYIAALFEFGKKVLMSTSTPSSKQFQTFVGELEFMHDAIAKKCVKVNAAVSIVIKAQCNGLEPDLSVVLNKKVDLYKSP